jgi:hypothetical protein
MCYYMKTDLREFWSQNLSTLAFSKAGFCVCHAQRSKGFSQYELTDVPTSARTAFRLALLSRVAPRTRALRALGWVLEKGRIGVQFRHCGERQQRSNLVFVLEGSGSPRLCCSLAHVQFPVVKPALTVLITQFLPQVAR